MCLNRRHGSAEKSKVQARRQRQSSSIHDKPKFELPTVFENPVTEIYKHSAARDYPQRSDPLPNHNFTTFIICSARPRHQHLLTHLRTQSSPGSQKSKHQLPNHLTNDTPSSYLPQGHNFSPATRQRGEKAANQSQELDNRWGRWIERQARVLV